MSGLFRISSTWHVVGAQKTPALRIDKGAREWVGPGGHSRDTGALWALLAEVTDSCSWRQ